MKPHPVETCPCETCQAARIKYDTPVEVDRKKFNRIRKEMAGLVATHTTGYLWWKRYYVKLWFANFKPHLSKVLGDGMPHTK